MTRRIRDLPGQTDLLGYLEPAHQGRIAELEAALAAWVEWAERRQIAPGSEIHSNMIRSKVLLGQ
jgi:hypothetical protein